MKKKNNAFKALLIALMAIIMLVSNSMMPVSTSAALNEEEKKLLEISQQLPEFNKQFKNAESETIKEIKKEVNKLVADKKISLSEKSAKLDFSNTTVKEDIDSKLVHIPVKYNNLNDKHLLNESFLIAIFEDDKLSSYQEIKIIGNSKKYTSDVASYLNGGLIGEETIQLEAKDFGVEVAEKESSSLMSFLAPDTAEASWWSEFKKCLNNQGVASWAVTSLTIACGFVCIGTGGAGCVPCLLGASLITEGVIAHCVFKARMNS